jgi:hypothetical protein
MGSTALTFSLLLKSMSTIRKLEQSILLNCDGRLYIGTNQDYFIKNIRVTESLNL